MTINITPQDDDLEAATELITDIEGELRLHLVRVHEFLEGTEDTEPVTTIAARARLMGVSQILRDALTGIDSLTQPPQ